MTIREKIMKLDPPCYSDESDAGYGFEDGLERAAGVAEAEVQRLEDVISDLNGVIAQYVTDEKRLEARVRELEDLARFMCATWVEIDSFVRENCTGDEIMKYPVIQGTMNQVALMRIAKQKYDKVNVAKAVERVIGGE